MTEVIGDWIRNIIVWADMIPIQGWAILFGILLGGAATQWLKRTFPLEILIPNMKDVYQVIFIRVTALVLSFIPTYILWPDDQFEVWAAFAVGVATPTVYRAISFFLYKKWPGLESKLSGTAK